VLRLVGISKIVNTTISGAARYLTVPIESTHSLVPSSIGVGLMTNKSPLASLTILALPPTFAP
jgi:phosphate/sulfate permease